MRHYAIERDADWMPVRLSWSSGWAPSKPSVNARARRVDPRKALEPRESQLSLLEALGPSVQPVHGLIENTNVSREDARNRPINTRVLVSARDIPIHLSCPACRHTWLSAILTPGAWWAAGLTPAKVAKVPYCPQCDCAPPMTVAAVPAAVSA